jgi:hypothetical protein
MIFREEPGIEELVKTLKVWNWLYIWFTSP